MSVPLILAIVAAILAIVHLVEARGHSWLGWAVLALAAIHLYGVL